MFWKIAAFLRRQKLVKVNKKKDQVNMLNVIKSRKKKVARAS